MNNPQVTHPTLNRGTFGKNNEKTEETHADYKGSLDVDGVAHFLDGYIQHRKDGSGSFLSLRVKRKTQQQAAPAAQRAAAPPTKFDDADFPF
jgi:hypothetical protein